MARADENNRDGGLYVRFFAGSFLPSMICFLGGDGEYEEGTVSHMRMLTMSLAHHDKF
jgi:hypothetical protein